MELATTARTVKKERAERGLSLRDVAKRAKLTAQTVLMVEHGEASIAAAVRVMKALGIGSERRVRVLTADVRELAAA